MDFTKTGTAIFMGRVTGCFKGPGVSFVQRSAARLGAWYRSFSS